MILRFNKSEITKLLSWVLKDPKSKPVLDIIEQNVTMNGDITFKKNLKIGSVMIRVLIYPIEDGDLEINIKDASIAGFGVFGVVRKKAGEMMVTALGQHLTKCKVWKNDKGNVQLHTPGIVFKQFGIVGEDVLLELSV